MRAQLKKWIETDSNAVVDNFIQVDDAGCYDRATKTIPKKWNVTQTPLLDTGGVVRQAAAALGKKSFKGPPICSLKAPAKWGGATTTRFAGFHYVLLIGTGFSDGKQFCVVYDPDVTATERSSKAWAKCGQGVDKTKPATKEVIEKMILGREGKNKLGALVRYYFEC